MSTILPINLDDLLRCRSVEPERVEFEASWDPHTTGPRILQTICAFANDLHNLNGGYVIVGVKEEAGRAILPPTDLSTRDLEGARKWIRGNCNRLDPPYAPILSPETIDDRHVLVAWAPASDMRPHRTPATDGQPGRYWIRLSSETVDAEQRGLLRGLIEQTARVPWDDRRASDARIEDLREAKVREFLRDVRSGLLDEPDEGNVYRRMRLTRKIDDHEVPRNFGLLFFAKEPSEWFRGAKIEVVRFAADHAGNVQEERVFGGGLSDQLRDCLNYLENFSTSHLQKRQHRSQVRGWVSYPLPALRETVVNAVYHRSYDVDQPEPVKIYLYPNHISVISYPGPVAGIEARHLLPGAEVGCAPARNRRIGEFLKELGLAEGRLTGLRKVFQAMETNGSPQPRFEFGEQRTYFQATLQAHPEFAALSALRDAAHLRALGEFKEALLRMEEAWHSNHASAFLASEIIRAYGENGDLNRAENVLNTFRAEGSESCVLHVANALIKVFADAGDETKARQLLEMNQSALFGQDAVDAAILARRVRDFRRAHRYFELAGDAAYADPRALLEFAQTKLWLAGEANRTGNQESNRRLLREARTLLERVIRLDASPTRHAWAWYELARTLQWLRAPVREIEEAYRRAIELLPEERRFRREMERVPAAR